MKSGLAAAAAGSAFQARAMDAYAPSRGLWRTFEVTTRLQLASTQATKQAWVPLPSFAADDWMRPQARRWTTNAQVAQLVRDPKYGAEMLHLVWAKNQPAPLVEIVSTTQTRDRAAAPHRTTLSAAERKLYTAPTALIPTDGLVKATSDGVVARAASDEAKARAIYEWVVENTYRKGSTRGCASAISWPC